MCDLRRVEKIKKLCLTIIIKNPREIEECFEDGCKEGDENAHFREGELDLAERIIKIINEKE